MGKSTHDILHFVYTMLDSRIASADSGAFLSGFAFPPLQLQSCRQISLPLHLLRFQLAHFLLVPFLGLRPQFPLSKKYCRNKQLSEIAHLPKNCE